MPNHPRTRQRIEVNVTKKETLGVRIDQSGKFSAVTLLRAMDPIYSSNEQVLRAFYPTKAIDLKPANREAIEGMLAVGDVIDPETGEVLLDSGEIFTKEALDKVYASPVKEVEVLGTKTEDGRPIDMVVLNSIKEDPTTTHEEAASLRIYQRLRPGNPPQLEKAREQLPRSSRIRTAIGSARSSRFRINRKYNQDVPESEMTLRAIDFLDAVRYILDLRSKKWVIVDIDLLGNRLLRTIDELAADELACRASSSCAHRSRNA